MHAEVDRDAVGRGKNLAVLQVETSRGQLLLQGHAFQLRLGQLAAHLFLVFLAALLQVEPRLDDALLKPCAIAAVLRQVTLDLGQLPLILQQAVARNVTLAGQRLEVLQLLTQ
ncbi:hypothetical protein D9M71_198810 [compost metagenome]